MPAAKDALGRDLRGRLELPVVRGERANGLQPARSGDGTGVPHMLPGPAQHQALRERAAMYSCIGVPSEAREFGGG